MKGAQPHHCIRPDRYPVTSTADRYLLTQETSEPEVLLLQFYIDAVVLSLTVMSQVTQASKRLVNTLSSKLSRLYFFLVNRKREASPKGQLIFSYTLTLLLMKYF